MITVREFLIKQGDGLLQGVCRRRCKGVLEDYDVFVIAVQIFNLFQNRDVEGYKETFQEYYLNKQ